MRVLAGVSACEVVCLIKKLCTVPCTSAGKPAKISLPLMLLCSMFAACLPMDQ